MSCWISSEVLAAITAHAAGSPHAEVCGLLFGEGDWIERACAAINVASDPTCRFEIDPAALIAALRAERGGGPPLLGYYHSHPSGDASPSRTDAEMAAPDGRLWLIVAGTRATLWRAVADGAVHGRFDPARFTVSSVAA